ncbi:MAG: hypothetical protein LBK92_03810 [Endomicrobium sp.]|jgi:hypothetical protein|nr:hypothetical protein [Endomicrobium sp.]
MTYKEFSDKLNELGLTRQEFAKLSGYKYKTILDWVRPIKSIPDWVESWLYYYDKAKKSDELIEKIEQYKSLAM